MTIRHALISVSDKTGLTELAAALKLAGAKLYATGGTSAALKDAGHDVTDVGDLTGYDEMLDGRVKTLHPNVHAAILADMQNPNHVSELGAHGLPKMDLVVVNFYPFEKVVATNAPRHEIIENIDIGGPTMARSAAKNYQSTFVLTDPADYPVFIAHLKGNSFTDAFRFQLANKAFVNITRMDTAIANYFIASDAESARAGDAAGAAGNAYPEHRFVHLKKVADLKYGENPHQTAACYRFANSATGYMQLQGGELSYNNLLDAYSALSAVSAYDEPAAVIVKHNTPCGIAAACAPAAAYAQAAKTDPVSAFGGIVALNRPVDEETAQLIQESFYEVVIAPQFTAEAKSVFALKERLRVVIAAPDSLPDGQANGIVTAGNLLLMQQPDRIGEVNVTVAGKRQPSEKEMQDAMFAWRAVAAVKSNAILLARRRMAIGIGAGQMSRLDAARIACDKAKLAKHKTAGSVAASDGFFPFADGVEILAKAGVTTIIQPGGSVKDEEVIAAADAADVAMLLTGKRHFRH